MGNSCPELCSGRPWGQRLEGEAAGYAGHDGYGRAAQDAGITTGFAGRRYHGHAMGAS
jgi:hypothetical protein